MNNPNDGLALFLKLDDIQEKDRTRLVQDSANTKKVYPINEGVSLVPDDIFGACLKFDDTKKGAVTVDPSLFHDIKDTFTLTGWVVPTTAVAIDPQKSTGTSGTVKQKFMIYPLQGDEVYGAGHAGTGISVGTNGIIVYEHADSYFPPLLTCELTDEEKQISGWRHLAVVYHEKRPSLYLNGKEAKVGEISSKIIHPSALIGGGRWGHFPGKIANVRVYNKALTLVEIQQVMDDDQLALPAYRKGHPIDFSLFDENQNYVLYISDDPEEKHILKLELRNTSSQAIQFLDGEGISASSSNYHFKLVFRPDTLSAKTLKALQAKTGVLKNPRWDLFVEDIADASISLYLLYKGKDKVFSQSEAHSIVLHKMSAEAGSGTRGTQVELGLNNLAYLDDARAGKNPPPITGTRVQNLHITNHLGIKTIPLHVGFVGSNRILNDGHSENKNSPLQLRITNTSRTPLSLKGASFALSFDVGDESQDWAIATEENAKTIEIKVGKTQIKDPTRGQGSSLEWKVEEKDLPDQLAPNQHLEITLSNIRTNHPSGYTNLTVNYSVPGYWDGQLVCVIEKTPLLFYDYKAPQAKTLERRVGIGTATPSALLTIDPQGAGGITIGNPETGKGGYSSLNLKISAAKDGYASVQSIKASGKAGGYGTLALNPSGGDVGIGTEKPRNNLDVKGRAVIGRKYAAQEEAPPDGLLVEGNVGIGVASTSTNGLHVGPGKSVRLELGKDHRLSLSSSGSFLIDATDGPGGRLIVNEKGNVGIGNANPDNLLHIGSGKNTLVIRNDTITGNPDVSVVIANQRQYNAIAVSQKDNATVTLTAAPTAGYFGTMADHPLILRTHNFDRLRMEGSGGNDGRVTVQGSLYVEGGLSCQRIDKDKKRWWSRIEPKNFDPGDWQYATFTAGTPAPSDIRFKTDLSPITDALAKVKQLNGTYYRWGETGLKHLTQKIETTISAGPGATEEENQNLWAEERQKAYQALAAAKIGLIAQNVETVAPEVVHEDKDGYKYIDYQDLTALLVEAIKEQLTLIERLQTRLSTLEVPI